VNIAARFKTLQRKGHHARISLHRESLHTRCGHDNEKACQKRRKGETELHDCDISAWKNTPTVMKREQKKVMQRQKERKKERHPAKES
jgi:hypothetical protein